MSVVQIVLPGLLEYLWNGFEICCGLGSNGSIPLIIVEEASGSSSLSDSNS